MAPVSVFITQSVKPAAATADSLRNQPRTACPSSSTFPRPSLASSLARPSSGLFLARSLVALLLHSLAAPPPLGSVRLTVRCGGQREKRRRSTPAVARSSSLSTLPPSAPARGQPPRSNGPADAKGDFLRSLRSQSKWSSALPPATPPPSSPSSPSLSLSPAVAFPRPRLPALPRRPRPMLLPWQAAAEAAFRWPLPACRRRGRGGRMRTGGEKKRGSAFCPRRRHVLHQLTNPLTHCQVAARSPDEGGRE